MAPTINQACGTQLDAVLESASAHALAVIDRSERRWAWVVALVVVFVLR